MSDIAVLCRNVTKSFGEGNEKVMALRGIDIEISKGELMMFVGPSGCGKTTLISVIAGILDHDNGTCKVFNNDLKKLSNSEKIAFRAKNIGFVFQTFNLLPTLSAAENVSVPLIINNIPRREAINKASDLLERVGLGNRTEALPSELSGGQQQRVAIARALIHEPGIIVCDEPTSSLDHVTGMKVMELMREIVLKESRTLIVVTHDNRIFPYADRIAVMDDGKVEKVVNSYKELEHHEKAA